MEFEKFGKTYLHRNPRKYIYSSLCKVQTLYANSPRNVRGRKEYVSKKLRRINRKWEEITAALGFLSDSSLRDARIQDKI
jgi:hypothetical protein